MSFRVAAITSAAAATAAAAAAATATTTTAAATPFPTGTSAVTSWADPEKARQPEKSYAMKDVMAQRTGMLAMTRARPGERCLDVGCGPGS